MSTNKPNQNSSNTAAPLNFNDNLTQEKEFLDLSENTSRKVINKCNNSDVYTAIEQYSSSRLDEYDKEIIDRQHNLEVCYQSYLTQCEFINNAKTVLKQCERNLEAKRYDMKLQIKAKQSVIKQAKWQRFKEFIRINSILLINKIFQNDPL